MLYAVIFEDNAEFANVRSKYMTEHLAFLARNGDAISAAGPLVDPYNDTGAGGMWLVKVDTPQKVSALVEEDPFWSTGLRKSVRILAWKQVFPLNC